MLLLLLLQLLLMLLLLLLFLSFLFNVVAGYFSSEKVAETYI